MKNLFKIVFRKKQNKDINEMFKKNLGFGFFRLPTIENGDIDYDSVSKMVDAYMNKGFNYFETAYMYLKFNSETAIRKCLVQRYNRNEYFLCDKMPIRMMKKNDSYEDIFSEQLKKCGVEYFDVYLLHNLGQGIYGRVDKNGGFEFLNKIKNEGKARFIGFSFHDKAEVLDKILTEHPEVDVVQLQINYFDWESPSIQSKLCYEVAKNHGKPVIVMEPIKGGNLIKLLPQDAMEMIKEESFTPASFALNWVASLDNVKMVLSGMGNIQQVEENVNTFSALRKFSDKEYNLGEKVVELIKQEVQIDCTNCKYCLDVCPKNIPIWNIFDLINTETRNGKIVNYMSKMMYQRACYKKGKASDCISCGLCEEVCSQKINIREELKMAVKLFEKKKK